MSTPSPRLRPGSRVAGAAARRRIKVADHVGSYLDFVDRLSQAAEDAAHGIRREEYLANLFDWATDERLLKHAWDYCKQGGDAPGVDGMRYEDIPDHALWRLLRNHRQALRSREYTPADLLDQEIPKGLGRGTRTLQLPTVIDRVTGRILVEAVQPYLDPALDENSFGHRPGRNRLHALAKASALATREDRWTWAAVDIEAAFPSVPRSRLGQTLHKRILNEDVVTLICRLVDRPERKGIPQGQPLAPMCLSIFLDHVLDRPWRQRYPDIPMIRFADDILLLAKDEQEAQKALMDLHRLLVPAGMRLQNTGDAVRNLENEQQVEWVGFRLDKADSLQISLSKRTWDRLADRLADTQRKPQAPVRAIQCLQGWIRQAGPAFQAGNRKDTASKALSLARHHGFEELPTSRELMGQWEQAYTGWCAQRDQELQASFGGSAAAPITSAEPRRARDSSPAPPAPAALLYTDGACLPGARGGWAFVIDRDGERVSQSGGHEETTSNRMELTAAIRGLSSLQQPTPVQLRTDSQYLVEGIRHLPRWRRQYWRAGRGRSMRPLKNVDLWRQMAELLDKHDVDVQWIPGHAGYELNELCDQLAYRAAMDQEL